MSTTFAMCLKCKEVREVEMFRFSKSELYQVCMDCKGRKDEKVNQGVSNNGNADYYRVHTNGVSHQ